MTAPLFQLRPAYSLPRPDRLLKGRNRSSAAGDDAALELEAVLAAYDLAAVGPVTAMASAGRSRVLVADTGAGPKLIKRYKSNVSLAAVEHEHSILRHLAQIDFPAPRLVLAPDGASLLRRGDQIYALFDYLEGYFQYGNRLYLPSQTRQFLTSSGRVLGALHWATASFTPEGHNPNGFLSRGGRRARELAWFEEKLDWSRQQAGQNAAGDSEMIAAVGREGQWLAGRLQELDLMLRQASLSLVVIHGDFGPYNLLFKRGARVVIVDFELARLDWALVDLAKSMATFARNRFGFSRRKATAFLEAYRSAFDMSADETAFLPDVWLYLTLRRVVVCWFRYFKDGNSRWADEAQRKLKLAHWIEDERGGNLWQ